jgi:hypothetical protein
VLDTLVDDPDAVVFARVIVEIVEPLLISFKSNIMLLISSAVTGSPALMFFDFKSAIFTPVFLV